MKINAFRLSFWGGDTAHYNCEDVHPRVGTPHIKNIFKYSDLGGDTAEGGDTAH